MHEINARELHECINDVRYIKDTLKEERAEWKKIAAELASIAGSLRVLLDDRETSQSTLTRVFSRLDACDHNLAELKARVDAMEPKVATTATTTSVFGERAWDIVKYVLLAVLGAIIALTQVRV